MEHTPAQLHAVIDAQGKASLRDELRLTHATALGCAASQSKEGHRAYSQRVGQITKLLSQS